MVGSRLSHLDTDLLRIYDYHLFDDMHYILLLLLLLWLLLLLLFSFLSRSLHFFSSMSQTNSHSISRNDILTFPLINGMFMNMSGIQTEAFTGIKGTVWKLQSTGWLVFFSFFFCISSSFSAVLKFCRKCILYYNFQKNVHALAHTPVPGIKPKLKMYIDLIYVLLIEFQIYVICSVHMGCVCAMRWRIWLYVCRVIGIWTAKYSAGLLPTSVGE